jgi:hypothetical protein
LDLSDGFGYDYPRKNLGVWHMRTTHNPQKKVKVAGEVLQSLKTVGQIGGSQSEPQHGVEMEVRGLGGHAGWLPEMRLMLKGDVLDIKGKEINESQSPHS